ncbi:MAG: hypothetical protein KOO61_07715 [Spirochaetales bacterium]|nr:hypothetical protein [Spirochaetales bacterium]
MLESVHVGDADRQTPGPTIVLCHGFGADAQDLAPLAHEIPLPGNVRWLFPQAPYRFQMAWSAGRAWFPRDSEGIESFLTGEGFGSLAEIDPPGLNDSSRELIEFMDHMGCDPARTVVGGFSQGAMVAADATLRLPRLPAGLLLCSGSIIAADRLRRSAEDRAVELRGLQVAQYHGQQDPVLPFGSGQALAALFESAGAAVQFTAFPGGHGIPQGIFPSIAEQLGKMLELD